MRAVEVAGVGLFCPAGIGEAGALGGRKGEVPDFSPKAYVRNRKNLKLMSRSVRLGVSAIRVALSDAGGVDEVPPIRRGMFVGTTPLGGEFDDIVPALEIATDDAGRLDVDRFAEAGYPLIHPLWLVKGLSNNVLGFASASHDFQGVNANYCDGDASGANALYEGWAAVAEGRADVVVAGAADAWVGLDPLLGGRRGGEGAAFFLLRPAGPEPRWCIAPGEAPVPDLDEAELGYLGAAGLVVALARRLYRGEACGFPGPGGLTLRVGQPEM
ncbi:MAG: hypothetical protein H6739_31775 [Alphaproteobacteria bacterium]|nr:hypothetical protein [Alphaproteobacteria bacterium]